MRLNKIKQDVLALTMAQAKAYEAESRPAKFFRFSEMKVEDLLKIMTTPDAVVDYCAAVTQQHKGNIMTFFDVKKSIENGLTWLAATLRKWDIPLTADEIRASEGVEFPTFAESMLLDVVEWYGCGNTDEAGQRTVGEWYLFAKKRAAANKYRNNYNAIIAKK